MKIQMIKVVDAFESPTNPRTLREDQSFKDLVASIKEKGILVPVIARPAAKGKFEIVAGNRRLKAAQVSGLKEIPADVREMADAEAREVQIIENLQRADVHPLDEGEAYRQLHEKESHEIKTIAVKVGKSEDYVRQRMFLTNLNEQSKKAYRAGEIHDGFAVLIAKLDPGDQADALKYAINSADSIKDLQQYIQTTFYKPLQYQPWVGKPEMEKIVGPCKECPPARASLFGDVREGACTTLKCWQRKMDAYLAHRVKEEKLVKVSKEYSYQDKNGIVYENHYKTLSTKAKEHCESAEEGLVVEGRDMGTTLWICRDPKCKKHSTDFSSGYSLTPAEKAARKRQLAQAAAKEKKEFEEIAKAGKKITWPFEDKHLEVLVMITLANGNSDPQRRLVKSKGWEILRTKGNYSGPNGYPDYRKTLETEFAKLDIKEKAQLLFEVLLNETSSYDGTRSNRNKAIKML